MRGWKKASDLDDHCDRAPRIIDRDKHPGDDPDTGRRVNLIGGTAWHWAGVGAPADDHADSSGPADDPSSVDVLLIDEAGQVSLADAIAVSRGTRSVVLLGDPQQLAHVSQGTHAHGSGASVLEHLLAGEQTVPRDRGVFLGTSWRMHPRSATSSRARCTTARCARSTQRGAAHRLTGRASAGVGCDCSPASTTTTAAAPRRRPT